MTPRCWLERARVLILAGRPLLAIDDGERAFKLQPASMRVRIELAEASPDAGEAENAAKLDVDRYLCVVERTSSPRRVRPVADMLAMRHCENSERSTRVYRANPKDADALIARAKILRDLRQFTLADANVRWRSMINRQPQTSKRHKTSTVWTGKGRRCCMLASRRSWILTIQTSGSSACVLERQRADFAGAVASQTLLN